jgi:hypothetical protein
MTRRYTSGFDILGFDTDPTPGDPGIIMSQVVPTYQSIGDDAEAAYNALNSDAIENGAGQTMQALQNMIGTSFPPKLQTCADSYHSAASIYTVYAQALTEAQNMLDQAMDQAVPVAALANSTVPPAPPNASADQVATVQQQQQSVDQANDQLTAAKQLGQDAADMRTQAGNTFNTNLNDVSSIPAPTPPSWWQDIVNFFENTFVQIFVDIAIAVTSIFCPVLGLALGVLAFGLTTVFNTIASGSFDIGAFVTGLFTLAVGGLAAAGVFAKIGTAIAKTAEGAETAGGSFFSTAAGSAAKGIQNVTNAVGKLNPFAKGVLGTVKDFGVDSATDATGDAIDHKDINAAEVFGGAAVGAVIGTVSDSAKDHFGFGDEEPDDTAGSDSGDDTASTPGEAGTTSASGPDPAEPPLPPTPEESPMADGPDKPLPPTPEQSPSGDGFTWVSSPHQAGANAFDEGGKVIGGLVKAGAVAAIVQAQGGDETPGDAANESIGGLEPDVVGVPITKETE